MNDANTSANHHHQSWRDYYVGLLFCCPYSEDNSNPKCQLYQFREKYKTAKQKYDYWKALSFEQQEKLIENHKKCLCKLENEMKP